MDSLTNCPQCGEKATPDTECCRKCGTNLELARQYEALRRELHSLRGQVGQSGERLEALQWQLANFGASALRQAKLAARSPIPPAAAATPVPAAAAVPPIPAAAAPAVRVVRPGQDRPAESAAPRGPVGQAPAKRPRVEPDGLSELGLGQKGLLIAGIVVLVLGIAYFLKYSFDQGWVTPAGRVAMAFLSGAGLLAGGEFARRQGYRLFGLYLMGGGIATLYFASFASFQVYHLLPQGAAFGVMVVVTALACTLAVIYNTIWLALLGLVGGFATPLLLATGVDAQVPLMGYLTILNLGILALAYYKRWDPLNALGLLFTWGLFGGWFVRFYQHTPEKFWPTLIFLNVFFLIYALVPFVYYLGREGFALRGMGLLGPNAFIAFGFSYAAVTGFAGREWMSVVCVLYALLFIGMATLVQRRSGSRQDPAFVAMVANASVFLVLAIPMLFTGHWITLFWAVEAAVLLWLGTRCESFWLRLMANLLLLVAAGKYFCYDYPANFHLHLLPTRFQDGYWVGLGDRAIAGVVVLGVLLFFAWASRRWLSEGLIGETARAFLRGSYAALFGLLLFAVLNVEVLAYFNEAAPRACAAAVSVLWTLYSIALMVLGFGWRFGALRFAALALFTLTLVKIFLVDMANASTPFRIVSFMVLGAVMIGASFLYYKYRDRIAGHMHGEESAE